MDYAYFTISRWIETIQVDAGDGKYEIIVLVCQLVVSRSPMMH